MNINDIAKLAGVSKATVSRVLNGIKVRPEYKDKVDRVLKETGYKPNRIARELVSRKTKLIGLILPSLKPNIYSFLVEGINRAISHKGYSLVLATYEHSKSSKGFKEEKDAFMFMKERLVEGIIYFPSVITKEHCKFLDEYDIPLITVGDKIKDLDIPSILFDDYKASKDIVEYLIELGHKNIGYIGVSDEHNSVGAMRRAGYIDAMKAHGLEVMDKKMIQTGFSPKDGYAAARELYTWDNSITAVFTSLDRLAIGAMSYFNKAGYSIPKDISIVGIDDDESSSYYNPPLTTIRYEYVDIGIVAGNIILDIIEGNGPVKDYIAEYKLMIRNSTI